MKTLLPLLLLPVVIGPFTVSAVFPATSAAAQKPGPRPPAASAGKKPPQKPRPNSVKGQAQLAGANGQFGVVYSLQSGINFAILSARYTLEPFNAYSLITAGTDEKILVLDIAVKNAYPRDLWFNPDSMFTFVDDKGQTYQGTSLMLQSKGSSESGFTLRPAQGLGQPALGDPLRIAVKLPAAARIAKIMINDGRLGKAEKVMRYYVAGAATRASAGEEGDPRNLIAPLPENTRDPSDPSGVVPAEEGRGVPGAAYVPSGYFALRLDGFAYVSEPLGESYAPEDGKKFAVATVTAKCLVDKNLTFFEVGGGDQPLYQIISSDGERMRPVGLLKAKRAESADFEFKKGDEYTFRVVFSLPKDATAQKLVLGTGGARRWAYDVSTTK